MGEPVTIVASGGILVTESPTNRGVPFTPTANARPVTIGANGLSVTFISTDGVLWPGGVEPSPGGPGGVGSPMGLLLTLTYAA